jgi:AmmeMemoRadiSam system protein A
VLLALSCAARSLSLGAMSSPAVRSAATRRALLRLARDAVAATLEGGSPPTWDRDDPDLASPGAAFVTLRRRASGELRGCRGEIEAHRPVAESIIDGARAAAIDDPRFPPVASAELAALSIEISVLSPMRPTTPERVEAGRHGVLIRSRGRAGLLLPQVASELRWSREQLLKGVCQKAGLSADAWRWPDTKLFAFEAEVWGEED